MKKYIKDARVKDPSGGYSGHTMILTPDESQADTSEFRLFLQRLSKCNPSFEWEVGMVDAYIESTITSATEKMQHEEYWFRYIYKVGGKDIASYLSNMQKINYSSKTLV